MMQKRIGGAAVAYDVLIKNGNVVTAREVKRTSIGIKDGIICEISEQISGNAKLEWDAKGQYVFPGMVDVHVHFSEPGREHWEGFETGSFMMAAGGCTTYFDMPLNGIPSTIDGKALSEKATIGERKSYVDFGLWGGLVPGNERELASLAEAGVVGFKAFLSPSGNSEFEAADDETLFRGMKEIAGCQKILALHAESGTIVEQLRQEKETAGLCSVDDYAASRPIAAEAEAVGRAIAYAELTGCSLHFVHISSAEAVGKIREAKRSGLDITLETCPHYLLFNHEHLRKIGAAAKCAPPLREAADQKKLIHMLIHDQIDMISSDHSPSPWELKENSNFFKVWGGISGGQFSLLSMIELAIQYDIPFEKIARWTAEAPSKRFGLYPRKGTIMTGADADIAIISLNESYTIKEEDLYSRHKHSLYVHHTFPCRIMGTFSKGNLVYAGGKRMTDIPNGEWLKGKKLSYT